MERTLLSAAVEVDLGLGPGLALLTVSLGPKQIKSTPKSRAADRSVRPTQVWESS